MKDERYESRANVASFYAVTAFFWASLYMYQPIFSPYLTSINVSYTMIGLIGGSYGFTQMALRIPLGVLSDKIAKRKIFIIAGTAISVASSLMLFASANPYAILLGRALAGVAASAWVVFAVLFASYFPDEKKASRISFLNMYNSIGQAVAMLAGGLTAGYFGYRYPFAAGAFIGIGGIAFGLLVKEKKPERGGHVGVAELLSVIRDKNLLAMSALAIVSQFVFFGTTLTFVPLVAAGLGASPEELGFLSTLGNVPRILASLICGVLLARRFDSKIALASSYALLAVSCAATPFCPNLGALYAVNSATGFAYGVTMAITISLCTRDVEDYRRSAAMGFFQAIYGVGMFIGPVVVGVVSDNIGVNAGFYFAAIAAASGIAASLKFVRKA